MFKITIFNLVFESLLSHFLKKKGYSRSKMRCELEKKKIYHANWFVLRRRFLSLRISGNGRQTKEKELLFWKNFECVCYGNMTLCLPNVSLPHLI